MINLPTKFEVSISTIMKIGKEMQNTENEVVCGSLGSLKVTDNSTFDTAHMSSYWHSILPISFSFYLLLCLSVNPSFTLGLKPTCFTNSTPRSLTSSSCIAFMDVSSVLLGFWFLVS